MATSDPSPGHLRSRVRQQEVVAELSQRALETGDVDRLLRDAVDGVRTQLEAAYCGVFEVTHSETLRLRSDSGRETPAVGATASAGPDSLLGRALVDDDSVIGRTSSGEEIGVRACPESDIQTGLAVAIGPHEDPWGVLGVYTTERRDFTVHTREFVKSVAAVLASAIENAQTERRLREEAALNDRIVETSPVGITVIDTDGDLRFANDRAVEILQCDRETIAGLSSDDSDWEVRDADGTVLSAADRPFDRVICSGKELFDVELRLCHPEGRERWLSINGAPLRADETAAEGPNRQSTTAETVANATGNEVTGAIFTIEDVTEQKHLENELEATFHRIADAFIGVDSNWTITYANDRAETLIDTAGEGIVGRDLSATFPTADGSAFEAELREAMAEQEPTSIEDDELEGINALEFFEGETQQQVAAAVDEVFKTGSARLEADVKPEPGDEVVPYEFVASALEDPSGEPVLTGIGRDISERREHERRLEALVDDLEESNKRLEQFAYAASHDLQEPLRMVSSYLTLLERRYEDDLDEDAEEFIEFAVDGADRMQEMIDGLLQYSRVDTQGQSFQSVDVDAIVTDVCTDLEMRIEETDAEIEVGDLPEVYGDPGQLRQLFQNLIDNAITYSGEKTPRISVFAEYDETTWVISVRDQGIGIDPDDVDRIFRVFDRLHSVEEYDGTGIGLALCQRIAERHDGTIRVDSEPGEGSTFSVHLPTRTEREGDNE